MLLSTATEHSGTVSFRFLIADINAVRVKPANTLLVGYFQNWWFYTVKTIENWKMGNVFIAVSKVMSSNMWQCKALKYSVLNYVWPDCFDVFYPNNSSKSAQIFPPFTQTNFTRTMQPITTTHTQCHMTQWPEEASNPTLEKWPLALSIFLTIS